MTITRLRSFCLAAAIAAVSFGLSGIASAQDYDSHHDGWPKTRWGHFGDHNHRSHRDACAREQWELDRNTRTAINYYTLSFNAGAPELAVEKYIGV
ncbi:MAG: hypothetical protein PVI91_17555, partial [Gammaproteobacteria bacterium]